MLPALMAKNSRGRPNCRHGSQECQSGWLRMATRKPAASEHAMQDRHREAGMIDVGVAGDEDDVDASQPRARHLGGRRRRQRGGVALGPQRQRHSIHETISVRCAETCRVPPSPGHAAPSFDRSGRFRYPTTIQAARSSGIEFIQVEPRIANRGGDGSNPNSSETTMSSGEATIQALREALRISPDNLPLRQHLAETLLGLGRLEEAEQEYRHALAAESDNDALKVGLANVFYQQGKNSQALVIVETLIRQANVPARGYLLACPPAFAGGRGRERAVRQYREAIDADPAAGRRRVRPASRHRRRSRHERSGGRTDPRPGGGCCALPDGRWNGRASASRTSAAWRRSRKRFA